MSDTIFALASARGKAGISVIRVSGPRAKAALKELSGSVPIPRHASYRDLAFNGERLDAALILLFEGPASFTGEDIAEFHVHGSMATVNAVLAALSSLHGLRPAEAGEFTRRALENDKLDVAQVEGLGALIEAETESQRKQALRLFSGALGEMTERWRRDLVRAAALIEATIDFADEDVPVDVLPEVRELVFRVLEELRAEISGVRAAERIKDGFEVAIVGPPNVGKSSLLNALAGRDAAITSDIAGTTRDIVEVRMDIGGLPVTFLDTAGLRKTEDVVEQIGVARAKDRAKLADLRVILTDGVDECAGLEANEDDLRLVSKSDLRPGDVSAKTGEGVSALLAHIQSVLSERASGAGTAMNERHRHALKKADVHLQEALEKLENECEREEIIAESIRSALRSLDSLVGRVDVEHILGEIFANFCIGK